MGSAACFVAVWPGPEVVESVGAAVGGLSGVDLIDTARYHVTLRWLGQVEVDAAVDALTTLRSPSTAGVAQPWFERLGPAHVVVPIGGLDELAAAVAERVAPVEVNPSRLGFVGHMSVARSRDAEALEAAAGLGWGQRPVGFEVTEVSLMTATAEGYLTLARRRASQ
jgi:RNA 2',3'-cyclic 3'-phosphodiesterase